MRPFTWADAARINATRWGVVAEQQDAASARGSARPVVVGGGPVNATGFLVFALASFVAGPVLAVWLR